MTKLVFICGRDRHGVTEKQLQALTGIMVPDNILPNRSHDYMSERVCYSLANPSQDCLASEKGVGLGLLFSDQKNWDDVGQRTPDGNFLLARWDRNKLEILSDAAASRTGWYAITDDHVFLSSSMRAIVALLGNFELNEEAVSWSLGTGCLGPDQAWDRRIRMIPPQTTLHVDFKEWTVQTDTKPIIFSALPSADAAKLRQAITGTLSNIPPAPHRELSLSGGVDSRGLLMMMPHALRPSTFSIRAKSEPPRPQDDASIAARVAAASDVTHSIVEFDDQNTPLSVAMDRFCSLSEGRVDHFSAAAGGWTQWKAMHERGTSTILRGDEGFGWSHALSEEQVQIEIGVAGLHRHFTPAQIEEFGLQLYSLPDTLVRKENETLENWRDRLYHQHRLPVILSALTEAKAGYIDVINPFLSRHILETVRSMLSAERTEKSAFRKMVAALLPSVPYASKAAHRSLTTITNSEEFKMIAGDILGSPTAQEIFTAPLLSYAVQRLKRDSKTKSKPWMGRIARHLFPARFVTKLRAVKHSGHRPLNAGVLIFRMAMITKVVATLKKDMQLLNSSSMS